MSGRDYECAECGNCFHAEIENGCPECGGVAEMMRTTENELDDALAELADLRNLKTRIQNAYQRIGMSVHESSLAASVEETIRRLEMRWQDIHDLRVERDAMATKVYLYAQELEQANKRAVEIADRRDELREALEQAQEALYAYPTRINEALDIIDAALKGDQK